MTEDTVEVELTMRQAQLLLGAAHHLKDATSVISSFYLPEDEAAEMAEIEDDLADQLPHERANTEA